MLRSSRMSRAVARSLALPGLLALVVGCHHNKTAAKPDFHSSLPPGEVALRKIDPSEYPDFSVQAGDATNLSKSIDNSLAYLQAGSSRSFYPYLDITHDRAVASLRAMKEIVDADMRSGAWNPGQFNQQVRDTFEVYKSIGAPMSDGSGYSGKVLFTGYFTPIYDASLTRSGPYQYPLYKLPADLDRDPMTGDTHGRKTPQGDVPYYTRAQIEQQPSPLAGSEIAWLKSRWEAYVITIQGSARLKLADGRVFEIGYAGTNGYAYTSPGQQMLADGVITKDQYSLQGLGQYFAAHPQDEAKYLDLDQRYTFFTERPGGPYGKLNVPVLPFASIATDKLHDNDVYPRAMPAFLIVPVPVNEGGQTRPYRGFMLDQDTGGGIRASGRCDIYMGVGPQAEALAGHETNEGELYYVAVRPELMSKYSGAAVRR